MTLLEANVFKRLDVVEVVCLNAKDIFYLIFIYWLVNCSTLVKSKSKGGEREKAVR